MSATTKFIEDLENPENPLSDNDLLMASVRNGNGYVSRKITLETLAEYVNSRDNAGSENGSISCGYEIYDTRKDSTNDPLYFTTGNTTNLTNKTFDTDCRLIISTNYSYQTTGSSNINLTIDGKKILIRYLTGIVIYPGNGAGVSGT